MKKKTVLILVKQFFPFECTNTQTTLVVAKMYIFNQTSQNKVLHLIQLYTQQKVKTGTQPQVSEVVSLVFFFLFSHAHRIQFHMKIYITGRDNLHTYNFFFHEIFFYSNEQELEIIFYVSIDDYYVRIRVSLSLIW